MKRKLRPEDEVTMNALRQRALATINFVTSVQDFPLAFMYRENVERAASSGDLRKLRLIARDIDQMTIGLEPHQRDGLEAVLQQRLGIDVSAERAVQQARIAKIIDRGTIASEKERRHLEDFAEMLEATGLDPENLRLIRRLLDAPERREES